MRREITKIAEATRTRHCSYRDRRRDFDVFIVENQATTRKIAVNAENDKSKSHNKNNKPAKNQASFGQHSSGESDALVVEHVLQAGGAGNWIVDSGTTCHMCHDKKLFSEFR